MPSVAPVVFAQAEFDVRCEWGPQGVGHLAPGSDAVIIVDVLSFSTCVEIAAARGATVFPYAGQNGSPETFAAEVQAELATRQRSHYCYSLSPESLMSISPGTRLVLPSPNGATLSLATGDTPTLAGCLRNYRAAAQTAQQYGPRIAVIPAGERWPDGSLRPALEDWLAAGAIISQLQGRLSPEARLAVLAFRSAKDDIEGMIKQTGSGQELIALGFEADVNLAVALGVSGCAPLLVNQAYQNATLQR